MKRSNDRDDHDRPPKKKLFSVFTRSEHMSSFRWLSLPNHLGLAVHSCLYGENLNPPAFTKVAAFDLDGTIIKGGLPRRGSAALKWEWWRRLVPGKLKQLHQEGFSIVILSNQNIHNDQIYNWKKKIIMIANELNSVPFRILAATAKDSYRKPNPGMWFAIQKMFKDSINLHIDIERSFFVGDAAGRASDHAGTDRKFAENLGLRFHTPEEYFLNIKSGDYNLQGFHIRNLDPLPTKLPSINATEHTAEIVMLLGNHASGKTTLYERHFKPAGYKHLTFRRYNQSIRENCLLHMVRSTNNDVSVVVELASGLKRVRKPILDMAKDMGVPVRCLILTTPKEVSVHYNLYRKLCQPWVRVLESLTEEDGQGVREDDTKDTNTSLSDSKPVDGGDSENEPKPEPDIFHTKFDFITYVGSFEQPELSEGFSEIDEVSLSFEGSELERKLWNMWLQVEGK